MSKQSKQPRCTYSGCGRIQRTPEGYCLTCADPDQRPKCACGADRGWQALGCRACWEKANRKMAKDNSRLCAPITREGMAELRKGWTPWHTIIDDDVKEMRIMQAQDLVTVGLLTDDQSRELYPSAWDVIDRRKASNMMEVE